MKKGLPRELILAVFAAALPASAAVYVWTGAAGTDFADAANWLVGDAVPSAPPANSDSTDLIVLPATVTVNQPVLTTNQDVRGLTIEGAGWTLTTGDFTFRVGPHNVGVTTTYTNGTSAIDGNLRVGTTDTPIESPLLEPTPQEQEIEFILENESAPKLIDVMCRRTEAQWMVWHHQQAELAGKVASSMAAFYGWDAGRKQLELDEYLGYVKKTIWF